MSPVRRAPESLTGTESTLRADHLREVLALLWPAPAAARTGRGRAPADATSSFVVVPGLGRPRLLVPAGAPRAAATAVRRYSEPATRLARYRLTALAVALRTGLGPLVMRDRVHVVPGGLVPGGLVPGGDDPAGTIEDHLAAALGREVRVGLHIGPARANRKPVLQVLSGSGELLGFVKVGVNDLTRRLVTAEGDSLERLSSARLRHAQVPTVLHQGWWRDLRVLVQSPLPIDQRRVRLTRDAQVAAMLEVASVDGVRTGLLTRTTFWTDLDEALDRLAPTDTVLALRAAFGTLTRRAEGVEVPMGSWHGDWTPWNTASVPGRVLVWDWERFAGPVPLGFDALHHDLQAAVVGRLADPRLGVSRLLSRAAELLAPFGVARADAEVVALSYLVALAVRYLQDGQAEAGARLGVLGQWLLPELVGRVAEL